MALPTESSREIAQRILAARKLRKEMLDNEALLEIIDAEIFIMLHQFTAATKVERAHTLALAWNEAFDAFGGRK